MVSRQKIMIVDDDAHIAELISLYLTKECFDTNIVLDGEEALKQFELYQPNLILLDPVSYTHLFADAKQFCSSETASYFQTF